jgi:hypothetical protein
VTDPDTERATTRPGTASRSRCISKELHSPAQVASFLPHPRVTVAMRTGSTLVRVVPGSGGGWDVREPGSTRALVHVASQAEAERRARSMLTAGGVIQVLDGEGFLLSTESVPVPGPRPWWYQPPLGFLWVLGPLFAAQGLVRIIDDPTSWFGWFMVAAGALHLSSVIFSRRTDRDLTRIVEDPAPYQPVQK